MDARRGLSREELLRLKTMPDKLMRLVGAQWTEKDIEDINLLSLLIYDATNKAPRSQNEPSPIESVPDELIRAVAANLSSEDVSSLKQVCHWVYRAIMKRDLHESSTEPPSNPSTFESVPGEVMRLIVNNMTDETVLSFKAVSWTAYHATKNSDESDVVSLEEIGHCSCCAERLNKSSYYRLPECLQKPGISPYVCKPCTREEYTLFDGVRCHQCNSAARIYKMHRVPPCMGLDADMTSDAYIRTYLCGGCSEVSGTYNASCEGCGHQLLPLEERHGWQNPGDGRRESVRCYSGSGEKQLHYLCGSCITGGVGKAMGWKLDRSKMLGERSTWEDHATDGFPSDPMTEDDIAIAWGLRNA